MRGIVPLSVAKGVKFIVAFLWRLLSLIMVGLWGGNLLRKSYPQTK